MKEINRWPELNYVYKPRPFAAVLSINQAIQAVNTHSPFLLSFRASVSLSLVAFQHIWLAKRATSNICTGSSQYCHTAISGESYLY